MKRLFAAIALSLFVASFGFAQAGEVNIIPRPADYEQKDGTFVLTRRTKIVVAQPSFNRGGEANFRFRWGIKGEGLRQAYGGEFVH